jgi:capsular exopolysaccharide synthesis family protein
VFTFVAETLDTSIGTIEDVESLLQVPVLGVIPYWEKEEGMRGAARLGRRNDLVTHFDPKSLAAEAFRSLRTNLQFVGLDREGKSFLITSSFVQEGKTANVANLALSMAQAGDKVLLVEGDLRKPLIHKMFGIDKAPGLTDYVLGNYDWKEIVTTITDVMLGQFQIEEILKTPGMDNLHIVTAGTNPPNPSEILRSSRFKAFLAEAYEIYDFIFIDAPPVLPVADATEIGNLCDGVILVYKVGAIARGILNRAKMSLDNVGAKVVGVILNNVKPEVGPDYFKYHAHYYYGQSGEMEGEAAGTVGAYVKYILLLAAIALLLSGIFWQNLFGP